MSDLIPFTYHVEPTMYGKRCDGFDDLRIAFDVKRCLHELVTNLVHRFEGIILEDFLTDLIPDVFLRIQLRRIRRQKL